MQDKTARRKLTLRKETITNLTQRTSQDIQGGIPITPTRLFTSLITGPISIAVTITLLACTAACHLTRDQCDIPTWADHSCLSTTHGL